MPCEVSQLGELVSVFWWTELNLISLQGSVESSREFRRWVKDSRLGQCKWNRRYFCPLMDCDIDRGGIMSKRYSRCRSARLGALCPPIPVFKYAMLTPRPRRQKWRQVLKEEMIPSSAIP